MIKDKKLAIGNYKTHGFSSRAKVTFDGKLIGYLSRTYASGYNPRTGATYKLHDWIFTPLAGDKTFAFAAVMGVEHRNASLLKIAAEITSR